MIVIEPVVLTDSMLLSSSVPEADYGEWAAGTTYALGDRVIKAATHRIYESAINGNLAHDPADPASSQWFELGPTNRWSMFDQSLGEPTSATDTLTVTLAPGPVAAVAFVRPVATSVRITVYEGDDAVYDEEQDVTIGNLAQSIVAFVDLPDVGDVQVVATLTGAGTVSIAQLVVGSILELGETESSPSIGITDYSKRDTDDFGVTTIKVRDWSKTMSLRTLVDTAATDEIEQRVAALRARPAVWIGDVRFDSLRIYGFFKSFSIDLALPNISYCSFSVEGLAA